MINNRGRKAWGHCRLKSRDDPAYMRRVITAMLEKDPAIQVVALLDGKDALEKSSASNLIHTPEMPGMDGWKHYRNHGVQSAAVVMVMAYRERRPTTLKALELVPDL